jgi:hypothetical protein
VCLSDGVIFEVNARSRWFAKNVRQVCDGAVSQSGRYRDTVRSETVMPSFPTSAVCIAELPDGSKFHETPENSPKFEH